jgi:hypothetical protein
MLRGYLSPSTGLSQRMCRAAWPPSPRSSPPGTADAARHSGFKVLTSSGPIANGRLAMSAIMTPGRFWDPAGVTAVDRTKYLAHRRQTEIMKGRIAMLDAMG